MGSRPLVHIVNGGQRSQVRNDAALTSSEPTRSARDVYDLRIGCASAPVGTPDAKQNRSARRGDSPVGEFLLEGITPETGSPGRRSSPQLQPPKIEMGRPLATSQPLDVVAAQFASSPATRKHGWKCCHPYHLTRSGNPSNVGQSGRYLHHSDHASHEQMRQGVALPAAGKPVNSGNDPP